jgi:hypothetical protein
MRGMKFTNIRQPMLKLKIHSGFHELLRVSGPITLAVQEIALMWRVKLTIRSMVLKMYVYVIS